MNKFCLSEAVKCLKRTVVKHSPEILIGVGISGMITGTVLAVRATPKAIILLEEKKKEEQVEKLTPIETVKTAWTCYIPTIVTSTVSIACLIGASSINTNRNAALATAYALSETALKEYREKVVETIGERKDKTIQDAVAKSKIEKDPVTNHEVILTNKGDTLCYDVISGRYFKSDIDKIKKAENILNRRMMDEMCISLNDLYYEIGLSDVKIGENLGWNIDRGLLELKFSSQLADDGTPCLVMDYNVVPNYDYAF